MRNINVECIYMFIFWNCLFNDGEVQEDVREKDGAEWTITMMMVMSAVTMTIMQVKKLIVMPIRGASEKTLMMHHDKTEATYATVSSMYYLHPHRPYSSKVVMQGWPCTGHDKSCSTMHGQPHNHLRCVSLAYVVRGRR